VSSNAWTLVTLEHDYQSMVIVATPLYNISFKPMVVRVRNATGNSFEMKIDRADNSSQAVNIDVHYVAVEEGSYGLATHGIQMESVKYVSTVTDDDKNWNGEQRLYENFYNNPVVLGQVMTHNDTKFSTFWSRGRNKTVPPTPNDFYVGKHVGEDPTTARANETIGYIVIEAGSGSINGYTYEADVGNDSVVGLVDGGAFYTLQSGINPETAILSQSAMDGGNGSWALLTAAPGSNGIYLATDEDQLKDNERSHVDEQVAYIVFEAE